MWTQVSFSTVAMATAIITFFAGIAAVTNARRINQAKHNEIHDHEPHLG